MCQTLLKRVASVCLCFRDRRLSKGFRGAKKDFMEFKDGFRGFQRVSGGFRRTSEDSKGFCWF